MAPALRDRAGLAMATAAPAGPWHRQAQGRAGRPTRRSGQVQGLLSRSMGTRQEQGQASQAGSTGSAGHGPEPPLWGGAVRS